MLSRLVTYVVLLAFVACVGGFAVLAAWDVPVVKTLVEKTLENSRFLEKSI